MPELPEAERARQQIERALDREIVAVDDRDTYVCRPHAPGEIAAALTGRRLTRAHRRGKFLWVETDDGPDLGLHLGMAGRIAVDEEEAPRSWDRFALEFADGGRMALRDKRRLGRAVIDPDFSHVGPDAAEVGRDVFRDRVGPRHDGAEGAAARPGRDRGRRQPARRRDAVARAPLARCGSRASCRSRSSTCCAASCGRRSATRSATAACTPAASCPRASAAASARATRPRSSATPIGGRTTYWCPHCQR